MVYNPVSAGEGTSQVRSPLLWAIGIAAHCFAAQMFLQSGAIVLVAGIALLLVLEPAGLLMVPIALFYGYVGLLAVRRAGQAVSNGTPLF